MPDHFHRIKQQYQNLQGDSTELFREVLAVSAVTGLDEALAFLEQCVIEKRSAWLKANLAIAVNAPDPVLAGYEWFYEKYLGASIPEDGEIVERTKKRMVMRWWNPCPTLEACHQFGLDTREVCRKAYHRPVQQFLTQIHPKLRFDRNYASIRPHSSYCEEIISREE